MERKIRILLWIPLLLCVTGSVCSVTKDEKYHGVHSKYFRRQPIAALRRSNHPLEQEERERRERQIREDHADTSILGTYIVSKLRGNEGLSSPAPELTEKVSRVNHQEGYKSSFETRNQIAAIEKTEHFMPRFKSLQTLFKIERNSKSAKAAKGREVGESHYNVIHIAEDLKNKIRRKREDRTNAREADDKIYFPGSLAVPVIDTKSEGDSGRSESFTSELEGRTGIESKRGSKEEYRTSCRTCSSRFYADSIVFSSGE